MLSGVYRSVFFGSFFFSFEFIPASFPMKLDVPLVIFDLGVPFLLLFLVTSCLVEPRDQGKVSTRIERPIGWVVWTLPSRHCKYRTFVLMNLFSYRRGACHVEDSTLIGAR